MATHSSVLPWKIPRSAEPGGLPSLGSHRVGHDWSNLAAAAAVVTYNGKESEKECIYVYITELLGCTPEISMPLHINHTSVF